MTPSRRDTRYSNAPLAPYVATACTVTASLTSAANIATIAASTKLIRIVAQGANVLIKLTTGSGSVTTADDGSWHIVLAGDYIDIIEPETFLAIGSYTKVNGMSESGTASVRVYQYTW